MGDILAVLHCSNEAFGTINVLKHWSVTNGHMVGQIDVKYKWLIVWKEFIISKKQITSADNVCTKLDVETHVLS